MINNKKAYKIFMDLSTKNRKKLSVEYEIEQLDDFIKEADKLLGE